MEKSRHVAAAWRGRPVVEGAGVRLRRIFGFSEVPRLDPFLLLDDFRSGDAGDYEAGFPWHPHRGIETITYMLAGSVDHGDSLGNQGRIGPGEVQWMTAGRGIIHQEMPAGDAEGRMEGFQLWANLPGKNKMDPPRYREIRAVDIPDVPLECGGHIRVICGRAQGVSGPVRDVITDPVYLDIDLPGGAVYSHPVEPEHTVLAYVIAGEISFRSQDEIGAGISGYGYYDPRVGTSFRDGDFLMFEEGTRIHMAALQSRNRLLLMAGRPLHEPVAWRGPIVMNTQEELDQAFVDLRRGNFIQL